MASTEQSKWKMRWVPEPTVALSQGGHTEVGDILLDVPARTLTIASSTDPSENLARLKDALDVIAEREGKVIRLESAPEAKLLPPRDFPRPPRDVEDCN